MKSIVTILSQTSPVLLMTLAVPVIYILAVAVGRTMRRRQSVQLGTAYQLFCVAFAFWLPMQIYAHVMPKALPMMAETLKQLDAICAVFGIFFVIALVRRYFWQTWFERKYHVQAPKFLSDLSALLLFASALVYAISLERGEPITGIAVGSTLIAAILGLALQDLLGNIIAGISLEIGKPFRPGDWLVIDTKSVEVVEVNWRSTRCRTVDDIYLDVPNRTIAGATITNLSLHNRHHALHLFIGFDYALPPNFVKDRLAHAAGQARGVLASPAPKVFLHQFGESAIVYDVKYWIEEEAQRNDITSAVQTNIWYEAQRSQMRIPFPTRTVQVERPPSRRGAGGDGPLDAARACLRTQPFMKMLSEEQTDRILRKARVLRFGRGERVIEQGADGHSMFILLSGEAEVFVRAEGHEHETRVGSVRAGEYCGEMSMLTGEPRSASVVAQNDCEMWEIDHLVLSEILHENRDLVQTLGQILAQRRLENEGVLASTASRAHVENKKKEYTEGFLQKVSSFFQL